MQRSWFIGCHSGHLSLPSIRRSTMGQLTGQLYRGHFGLFGRYHDLFVLSFFVIISATLPGI